MENLRNLIELCTEYEKLSSEAKRHLQNFVENRHPKGATESVLIEIHDFAECVWESQISDNAASEADTLVTKIERMVKADR